MHRHLPNLNQLRAFEAAARHRSFKMAADELHVTHAAISHQIKALEEDLGMQLFRRVTRGVQLAPEAEIFAADLSRSFEAITEAAARVVQARKSGPLRISSVPAYGMRVLLPRLPGLKSRHPDLDLAVDLELGLTDFSTVDAALRYGKGGWSGVTAELVHRDILCPVCAPALVAGRRLPLSPRDIVGLPIAISPGAEEDWKNWLRAAGHRGAGPADLRRMENRAVVLDYLLTGMGAALADLRFAATELMSGQLVRLHKATVAGVNAIHLVYPQTGFPDRRIVAFGAWLKAEAEAMDLSHGCPWAK
jgi:LysR family glycine cleavage system transcriptional activator